MDLKEMISEALPGVKIPLRPFWGTLGVAPPEDQGIVSSGPPGIFGGNLDNKEFTTGTIVYLPIHVKGALFSAGDGHAVQGDGEVNGTALEAEVEGTFQFFLRKGKPITWPRAETPTHFITMGLHRDLNRAAKLAVQEMVDYLEKEHRIRREDAYCLTSLAVDLRVTQCVSSTQGVHAMLPKHILGKAK
jgi:acetamidase/formamidase